MPLRDYISNWWYVFVTVIWTKSELSERSSSQKRISFPVCLWITVNNNDQLLAQTDRFTSWDLYLVRSTDINFVLPDMLFFFFLLLCPGSRWLPFMNHQGPRFQLKIFYTVRLKKKSILDGLWVSKLTASFQFWVTYPFKTSQNNPFSYR